LSKKEEKENTLLCPNLKRDMVRCLNCSMNLEKGEGKRKKEPGDRVGERKKEGGRGRGLFYLKTVADL